MSTHQGPLIAHPVVKAIPPGRDWLQSRLLVLAGVPVLCWTAWYAVQYALSAGASGRTYLGMAMAVSAFFGLAAWRLRAATTAAAACGALICFDITVLSGRPDGGSVLHSGLTCLVLLFLLTYAATRYRRQQMQPADLEIEKHGRNAAQVIANLGVAGIAALQYYWIFRTPPPPQIGSVLFPILQVPMISALAEATADTVSSEIGQALGGRPFLILNFRRVPPGTDGAISIIGTVAGIASAIALALLAGAALGVPSRASVHVVIAATAGLFFDSLLGATAERRGWIGNDAVNFASTLFAAIVGAFLERAVFVFA